MQVVALIPTAWVDCHPDTVNGVLLVGPDRLRLLLGSKESMFVGLMMLHGRPDWQSVADVSRLGSDVDPLEDEVVVDVDITGFVRVVSP